MSTKQVDFSPGAVAQVVVGFVTVNVSCVGGFGTWKQPK